MGFSELGWRSADGTKMYAGVWAPEERPTVKAVVGLVHGMGEHIGRYGHVADRLNREGYAVIGFDQRGHGRTVGQRGHTPTYDALLEGVDFLLDEADRRYPGAPRFLFGHSMGGNVTLNYLLRKQPEIRGAVVTGPWLMLAFKPPSLQSIVGKLVEKFYPGYSNNRPIVATNLTSDPEMIDKYVSDPLGHGLITARFFFGVQGAGVWALEHADRLRVPLLLMHGGDDKVTSIHASRQFAKQAGPLVEWREWPDFKHELHNETGREEVFAVILDWLNERLTSDR
ncbi:alpha/beta hydrolase [Paenibacillaceae bacterium WGS1546]|uniref:alpha/beta hydrolase n=1 Tax=Cohnella sp. WGS1546 TaxID=3366810 RepID=UPI00372CF5F6